MTDLLRIPPRPPDAHKGHFGRVQVVGGSAGMAGAPALAALAALRSGAGLVQIVCPAEIRTVVASLVPCATVAVSEGDGFDPTVRIVGPGCREELSEHRLLALLADRATPLVLDADGLNLLATVDKWWTHTHPAVVLTPHPGEMRRLLQKTAIAAEGLPREQLAREVAGLCGAVVVLKGHHTVVCDGPHCYVNDTGNPGMATAGSGDVLSGVIAALIGQGLAPYDAACAGVHIHGLAGDVAALELGQISMIATDIIDALPEAFQDYQEQAFERD